MVNRRCDVLSDIPKWVEEIRSEIKIMRDYFAVKNGRECIVLFINPLDKDLVMEQTRAIRQNVAITPKDDCPAGSVYWRIK
jgi:hypothetical protein